MVSPADYKLTAIEKTVCCSEFPGVRAHQDLGAPQGNTRSVRRSKRREEPWEKAFVVVSLKGGTRQGRQV